MVIGFDASRAFVSEKTGTEIYSLELLQALLQIDEKNFYRVYVDPSRINLKSQISNLKSLKNWLIGNWKLASPRDSARGEIGNFEVKPITWPRLWTQGGLALECLKNPPDVLFIPAHTMPVIRRPNLKTVVTIHDLGAEFLPEYHQFPHKYYLNWSTIYVVKHATKIIAISESTKRDLITKLHCDGEKIEVIYEAVRGVTKVN